MLIEKSRDRGIIVKIIAPKPPDEFKLRRDSSKNNQVFELIDAVYLKMRTRKITFYLLRQNNRPKNFDLVVMEQSLHSFQMLCYLFSVRMKKRIVLWGHGKTTTRKKSSFEHFVLRKLTKRANHFLSYTISGKNYISSAGLSEEKITVLFNSNYTKARISEVERCENKNDELNHKGDFLDCAFIGALDSSKRLDFLEECLPIIAKAVPQFRMNFYGDGPLREKVENFSNKSLYASYHGFANNDSINDLAGRTKLILNPGRIGLLAVDSLVLGIPIVTTDFHFHAPEFEYVDSIDAVSITNNCVECYAADVIKLLTSPDELNELRLKLIRNRDKYTIEQMVENFLLGLSSSLSKGANL